MQEYISRTWLMQNIRMDMKPSEAANVIVNAPVVEFDTEEPPRRGRCRRCGHYKGSLDDAVGTCNYWPGFVSGDDWCSNFKRMEVDT